MNRCDHVGCTLDAGHEMPHVGFGGTPCDCHLRPNGRKS